MAASAICACASFRRNNSPLTSGCAACRVGGHFAALLPAIGLSCIDLLNAGFEPASKRLALLFAASSSFPLRYPRVLNLSPELR